jgi:tight adherence protein B
VTAALLAAALALAAWPGASAVRRSRLTAVTGRRTAPPPGRGGTPVPLVACLLAVAAGAVLGTPLVAALAGAGALAGARAWEAGRRDRRNAVRLLAVTEGLGAFSADLRSGRSAEAAVAAAVAACPDPESGTALARAVRAGLVDPAIPDGALAEAMQRVVAGVRLSNRTGCSLAAVVTAVEDDLRARHRHRLELRSATAGPRASALLLAGLPVLGLAMGNGLGADPWQVLTATPTGQVLLVAGVGLELAGIAWSRRLVDRALR